MSTWLAAIPGLLSNGSRNRMAATRGRRVGQSVLSLIKEYLLIFTTGAKGPVVSGHPNVAAIGGTDGGRVFYEDDTGTIEQVVYAGGSTSAAQSRSKRLMALLWLQYRLLLTRAMLHWCCLQVRERKRRYRLRVIRRAAALLTMVSQLNQMQAS